MNKFVTSTVVAGLLFLSQIKPADAVLIHAAGLRGLKDVEVDIIGLTEKAQELGLFQSELVTSVELRLRQNGLHVSDTSLRRAFFLIHIMPVFPKEEAEGLCCYAIELHVSRFVRLLGVSDDENIGDAIVWSDSYAVAIGNRRLAQSVRDNVIKLVDSFLNDWLEANPRK